MLLRLVVGPSGLRSRFPAEVAEFYDDLVTGARVVAADFPFAAWSEPGDAPPHLDQVDVADLRRVAARRAVSDGTTPLGTGSAFTDPVLAAVWDRGPEHVVGRGAPPVVTGVARLGAYDHFLHHTGEPVVYSPADFAPVVRDNRAPGGVVLSAPRLIAELHHLSAVIGPDAGVNALVAAARTATAAGAALVAEYA
ncbi:hypothetical protein [Saccharothrix obliqua]|uniref:hypothetical protein n=1 Tax=Saccharothrix obliqua TaxID=2861747 RepID=UPI001C5DBDB6|nr:hypothetical protein [Saccharothrix obliqua]MBW4718366.1 hypothetical protein [Saccharothrix obliqua]